MACADVTATTRRRARGNSCWPHRLNRSSSMRVDAGRRCRAEQDSAVRGGDLMSDALRLVPNPAAATVQDAARAYIKMGLRIVPLKPGEKEPTISGWQKLRLKVEDVDTFFVDGDNIGIILGEGIVDCDLDSPVAVAVADDFLPPTG